MTFSNMQFISTVFRRILLALVIVASLFALGRSPVEAAPMAVTTSITANKSYHGPNGYGSYGNGNCNYSVTDMGDSMGNVDFGVEGYWLAGVLSGGYPPPWMVDGAAAYNSGVAWGFANQVCYGRGDSFSFNLSSIPVNAILQSASVTFTTVGASSNQGRPVFLNWSGGNMVMGYIAPLSPTLPGVDLGDFWANIPPSPPASGSSYTTPNLPVSTVQTWITNRTSGGMSVSIGAHPSWIFVTDGIALNLTYTTDTTPPTTTHALSGTLGNNGWYISNVVVTLSATDDVGGTGVASTTMDGSSYTAARTISTQGASTHTYFSTDAANNVESTKSFSLNIDTVAPSSAVTSHAANAPVRGTISLTGTASDATSGLASVQVSSDSGTSWNTVTLTGGNWSYSINTTSFPDGSKTFQVRSTDNAGNSATVSYALLVDNTPPTASHSIVGTMGNNGYYVTAPVVTISATDATSGVASRTFDGANYTVPVTVSTQGTTNHTYFATDAAGNNSTTGSFSIKVDTVAPSAAITSHTSNQPVRGTISFGGAASDVTSGLSLVEVSTDSGATWNAATLVGGNWSYSIDTTAFPDGSKTFQIRSTDNAGNQSSSSLPLLIDNTPPTIAHALSGTLGSNGWYTSNVTLTLTATDATSGIASRTFNSANYSAPMTLSTEGTTIYTYSTTDAAGNVSATQTVTVKIDTVKPVTLFSSPTGNAWVNGVLTLSGASADSSSGVAQAQISVDAGAWQNATGGATWTYSLNTATLSDGAHTIRARATDNAGNLESTATLIINVDNTTPSVSVSADCPSMGNDNWCKTPLNVAVSGGAGGSGVGSLTYSYNGNATTVNKSSASFVAGTSGTVSVYATNNLNVQSPTQSTSFKVDGAGPAIEFRGATRGQINFRVSDSESGVKRWTIQIFNARGESVFWQEAGIAFDGLLDWSGGSLAGGDYSVQVFASDVAGNESGYREGRFTLLAPTPTPTKIPLIQPFVNLFFPSSTPRPSATPFPTSTLRPTATATTVSTPLPRVAVLPPAPQPVLPQVWRTVSGVVFNDANRNGVQDSDEPGLPNVQLASMTAEGMSVVTYSGLDGRYVATVPKSDFYLVTVHLPSGLIPTLTDKQQFRDNGFDVTSNFPLTRTVIALWVLLIALAASLVWLVAQTATLDHRANALSSLSKEIETAFSVRLQASLIGEKKE